MKCIKKQTLVINFGNRFGLMRLSFSAIKQKNAFSNKHNNYSIYYVKIDGRVENR